MRWSFVLVLVLVGCGKNSPPEGALVDDPTPIVAGPQLAETTLVETTEYRLSLGLPATPAMFQLILTPKQGWKLNPNYPAKLVVAPPTGCEVAKPMQRNRDAVQLAEARASWQFDLASCDAGPLQLAGDVKFGVCTEKLCAEKFEKVAIALNR